MVLTLLMKSETKLLSESTSGWGGPPISSSPSPLSNALVKHGMMMYANILAFKSLLTDIVWKWLTKRTNAARFQSIL